MKKIVLSILCVSLIICTSKAPDFKEANNCISTEAPEVSEEAIESSFESQHEVAWKEDWKGYDYIVTTQQLIFLLNINDYYMKNKEETECFISYALDAKNAIDHYLIESGASKWIEPRYFTEVKKTYSVDNVISHTKFSEQTIYLNPVVFQWGHEYVHTMVFVKDGYRFYQEGIAEYLGKIAINTHDYDDVYLGFLQEYLESEKTSLKKVFDEYDKLMNLEESDETFNIENFYLANVKVSLTESVGGILQTFIDEPLYIRYQVPEVDRTIGDELSYFQAALFVEFLSQYYGFDQVIKSYIQKETMEESYGKSYEELKDDWITWLYAKNL